MTKLELPEFLYHGTSSNFLPSIRANGLVPGNLLARTPVHESEAQKKDCPNAVYLSRHALECEQPSKGTPTAEGMGRRAVMRYGGRVCIIKVPLNALPVENLRPGHLFLVMNLNGSSNSHDPRVSLKELG